MSKASSPPAEPRKLKFALLWHQHQPYYRAGDRFLLPWAWLHATKDYLEMAQHLERHPEMHATINLVPSLIKQLQEYLRHEAFDPVLDLMTKPANTLTPDEQEFLLANYFLANPHTVIDRSPRFREMHQRYLADPEDTSPRRNRFQEQDYRDLVVHYALGWTGEIARRTEPFASLIAKDRDYSEEDKQVLWRAEERNVRAILPLHRQLAKRGQIELTNTPFYHPILPLLIDTSSARQAMPDVSLPLDRFAYPEEALRQLERGRQYFKSRVGVEPKGLWPSEGSLSVAALGLIRATDYVWTATDEAVLDRSLRGIKLSGVAERIRPEHRKFFPWSFQTPSGRIAIFFRDHRLSDNIGFSYQSWQPQDAVSDFTTRLVEIRSGLVEAYGEEILETACVSVILDGENCWEYYRMNGFEFLDSLYAALGSHPLIETTTFSHAIEDLPEGSLPVLPRLIAGSWINANFRIWIGHPEDNAAWDALSLAKQAIDDYRERMHRLPAAAQREARLRYGRALEELMIAEGSDWCWWYGDDHYSAQKDMFDELFRMHLRAVYAKLDLMVPHDLMRPIHERPEIHDVYKRLSESAALTGEQPHIAGKLLNDSWIGIPNHAPAKVFGAMHRVLEYEIEDLKVAEVGNEVLFRLITAPQVPEHGTVEVLFAEPPDVTLRLGRDRAEISSPHAEMQAQASAPKESSNPAPARVRAIFDESVEWAIPVSLLFGNATDGTHCLRFAIEISSEGKEITRIPETGFIECEITRVG